MTEEKKAPNTSLKLHKGQKLVLHDPHRFRVIVAGRRWGKTQVSKIALITAAGSRKKQKVWYVATTYAQAKDVMWDDIKASVPRAWIRKIHETRMIIYLINGSIIQLKGADKPDSLRGNGLHFVVIDEAQDIKEETWEQVLQPTLATTNGKALFIGTPKSYNWLYHRFMLGKRGEMVEDARKRLVQNEWKSWQFPTISSPFIPRAEIEARRRDMDPRSFRQEFEASFETMSGRVYYPFDRNEHVGHYPFNPRLPIYIGMDFNIDPMSCIVVQEQPDGQIWCVHEVVLYGSNTQEAADELSRLYYRYFNQVTIYPDPAGDNRSNGRGETNLEILRETGFTRIQFKKKHPPVQDRINALNRLLRNAEGEIVLRVNSSCRKLIDSLEQTIYKEGSREVDKSLSVEHATDALGYYADFRHPMKKINLLGVSI
jgi:hypothetical protein